MQPRRRARCVRGRAKHAEQEHTKSIAAGIPGGHEVTVVDKLEEGLDGGALGDLLLAHALGDL